MTMAEYLDREDVLNVIDYIRTKYISVYNRRDKCSQFWADTIRYIEKQINNLDDYDVVPVRHGKWIDKTIWFGSIGKCCYECSECGYQIQYKPQSRGDGKGGKYCDDCGARMDGNEVE